MTNPVPMPPAPPGPPPVSESLPQRRHVPLAEAVSSPLAKRVIRIWRDGGHRAAGEGARTFNASL